MGAATGLLTALTALVFLAAAWVKFTGKPHAMDTRDRLGIAPGPYRLIGVAEVAGAIGALLGLILPGVGIAALGGLLVISVGACAAQVKLGNPPSDAAPAVLALLLSAGALILQTGSL